MAAIWIEFIITFFKIFFTVALVIWIIYMIVWGILKIFNKQRRLWIAFKLFGKKYHEKDVAWCMDAVERGMKETAVKKYLYLNNTPEERVEEVIFIFKEIRKEMMKGGELKHGGSEESNAKVELPKI